MSLRHNSIMRPSLASQCHVNNAISNCCRPSLGSGGMCLGAVDSNRTCVAQRLLQLEQAPILHEAGAHHQCKGLMSWKLCKPIYNGDLTDLRRAAPAAA